MTKRILALLVLPVLAACSENGPTGPSPSPSASVTLSVTDGATGQSLPGTSVTIAGRVYPSGAQVTARNGDLVDVQAQDFLSRQTLYRGESPEFPLSLWTNSSVLPADQTLALVYGLGQDRMFRLTTDRVAVVAPDEIGSSVEWAIARLNEATEGRVVFYRDTESSAALVKVRILVDPNDPELLNQPDAAAVCIRQLNGHVITGARIPFRLQAYAAPQLIAHELGHAFGLAHNNRPGLMVGDVALFNFENFTVSEKLTMRLMLQRRPGNIYPDNDRSVTAQSGALRQAVVACHFRNP